MVLHLKDWTFHQKIKTLNTVKFFFFFFSFLHHKGIHWESVKCTVQPCIIFFFPKYSLSQCGWLLLLLLFFILQNPVHLVSALRLGDILIIGEERQEKRRREGQKEKNREREVVQCPQWRRCTPYRGSLLSRTSIWRKQHRGFITVLKRNEAMGEIYRWNQSY